MANLQPLPAMSHIDPQRSCGAGWEGLHRALLLAGLPLGARGAIAGRGGCNGGAFVRRYPAWIWSSFAAPCHRHGADKGGACVRACGWLFLACSCRAMPLLMSALPVFPANDSLCPCPCTYPAVLGHGGPSPPPSLLNHCTGRTDRVGTIMMTPTEQRGMRATLTAEQEARIAAVSLSRQSLANKASAAMRLKK